MTAKRKPIQTRRSERLGKLPVVRIVSGGQTGADRAALDFAMAHEIPHGGWCPRGRLTEDGALATCYQLKETPDAEYLQRTEWNVRDSEGTVIFSNAEKLTGGSKRTAEIAQELGKPWLHLSECLHAETAVDQLREFVLAHKIRVLNVAGPRASSEPEITRFVIETLEKLFGVKTRASKLASYSR